jgi:DNA modification methylase
MANFKNRIIGYGEEPIDQILFNPANWRIHPKSQQDALTGVLEEVGWVQNVIVNKRTGHLVDGHLRVQLADKAGEKTVPVTYVDLSESEEMTVLATIDPIAAMAATDKEKLDDVLRQVHADDARIQKAIADLAANEGLYKTEDGKDTDPQIDKAEELRVKWGVESGQLWEMGEHRIICGDCTDKAVVEQVIGDDKADMVWTDPPYGMKLDTDFSGMKNELKFAKAKGVKSGKKYDVVEGDNEDFKPELITSIFDYFGYCKEMFLFGADYYSEYLQNKNNGSWVVWDKRSNDDTDENIVESRDRMFTSAFELCWSKTRHKRKIARIMWAGIFGTENENKHKRHHPTQKPTSLPAWFFNNWGKKGDVVFDGFLGSGTTLIACENLGRKCRAIEISPGYVAVALERWHQHTGKTPKLIS